MLVMGTLGAVCATTLTTAAYAQSLPQVTLKTSLGNIVLEIDTQNAPVTAANFLQYVREGFYDGTVFHRVISNFMIQGGGMTPDMRPKPTRSPIQLETSPQLRNTRGAVAMARTANPNSATAQFFINVKDNPNLDAPNPDGYGYAVFGRVVSGMDVADKIRAVQTQSVGPHQNVPVTAVVIEKATVTQE
nr:peptidylprolyl isomerase [Saezia sanguinis]